MRVPLVTRLSAGCIAVAALTGSTNAFAQHFYAIVWNPDVAPGDADDGQFINIQTDMLSSTCDVFEHNFVNHEMWYGVVPGGAYWVEVGFKDGVDGSGGCQTEDVFWADNRNGGGYNEHDTGYTFTLGDSYSAEITSAGSCEWNVSISGTSLGNSAANCPGSGRYLAAGIETTSQTDGNAKGYLSGWWEQNSSGTWTQSWDGPTICQVESGGACDNANPYIQWLDDDTETEEVLNESF